MPRVESQIKEEIPGISHPFGRVENARSQASSYERYMAFVYGAMLELAILNGAAKSRYDQELQHEYIGSVGRFASALQTTMNEVIAGEPKQLESVIAFLETATKNLRALHLPSIEELEEDGRSRDLSPDGLERDTITE